MLLVAKNQPFTPSQNEIIPIHQGILGKKVNFEKKYYNMKNLLSFSLIFLLIVSCGEKSDTKFKGGDETELKKKVLKFIQSSDYNSAIDLLNKTIQENPDKAYLYNSRAVSYQGLYDKDTTQKINLDKALADITKSISLEPNSERYIYRARIYEKLRKNNETLQNYSLAVNISQGDQKSDALNARAYFYFSQLKDSSSSFSDFKDAIKINSKEVYRVYLRYAQCLQLVGNYNEAINNYFLCHNAIKNDIAKNAIKDALYCGLCESLISVGDYLAVISLSNNMDKNYYCSYYDLYCKFKLGQEDFAKKEMKKKMDNSIGVRGKYYFEMFPNEPKRSGEENWIKMEQLKWPNTKIWKVN